MARKARPDPKSKRSVAARKAWRAREGKAKHGTGHYTRKGKSVHRSMSISGLPFAPQPSKVRWDDEGEEIDAKITAAINLNDLVEIQVAVELEPKWAAKQIYDFNKELSELRYKLRQSEFAADGFKTANEVLATELKDMKKLHSRTQNALMVATSDDRD